MNESNSLPESPRGWVWTRLGEVLSPIKGKKPARLGEKNDSLSIPYINIQAFEKKVFGQFTNGDGCTFCEADDVLLVWDGARCGLVGRGVTGAVGSTLTKLVCNELDSAYLFYFLQTKFEIINSRPKGIGIPHVQPDIFWKIPFPLPPLPEQHRIVAKIEELFTKLDAGVGKLTAEWREAHKRQMKPAPVLLERIREERKKNAKGKYKELPPLDTSDLPELPEGWVFTRLGDVLEFEYGKGLRKDKRNANGSVPVYGSNGIVGYHSIPLTNKASLIVGRKGAIGEVHLSEVPSWPIDTTYYIYPPNGIDIYYLYYLANTLNLPSLDKSTAIPGLNRDDAYVLVIPLPPPPEQHKIVEEIERHLSVADQIEKAAEQSLMRAERLRQSILKRAFEGKLVPQNPNDESAQKLLERIKTEKTKREAEKKVVGRGRKRLNTIQGRLM
jgi:type I restriction enzyme S subunit